MPDSTLSPGQVKSQERKIYLNTSSNSISAQDLQIEVQSGFDPTSLPEGFELGNFSVSGAWVGANWVVFSQPDGKPFGVSDQIIIFKGELPGASLIESYQPYQCKNSH